jgi:hypothetical protein
MSYRGSCHCKRIAFEVEGQVSQVIECNCSICSKRGYLLWFVERGALKLSGTESDLATYSFNTGRIRHCFCPTCGCAPFGLGSDKTGAPKAAINVRCLDGVDLAALPRVPFDGRSL